MDTRSKPLAGIRVLDLSRLLPGPLATQHLADMGAEVIKVEDTGVGDYMRDMGAGGLRQAAIYHAINRGKKSIALDLSTAEGRDVFLRLAAKSDVVVEGFRPGVVEKLGVGYAAVSAVNPAIVYCAVSGYGQTGPWRDKAGHDINYLSIAGICDQSGAADGPPALLNFQIADLAGGTLSASMGILAALVERLRTGKGRYVDVAMTDCAMAHAVFPLSRLVEQGKVDPRGDGLLTGGVPCYGFYPTQDGRHMAVGALEKKFWEKLCLTLDRPDLKPGHLARGAEGARVKAELSTIFRAKTMAAWTEIFDAADCCVTPVLTLPEALTHEQIVARGMAITIADPTDGPVTQYAMPVRFSDEGHAAPPASAPRQGQHTDAVLRDLGVPDSRIAELRQAKIIK